VIIPRGTEIFVKTSTLAEESQTLFTSLLIGMSAFDPVA